jgi:hypothetical protein
VGEKERERERERESLFGTTLHYGGSEGVFPEENHAVAFSRSCMPDWDTIMISRKTLMILRKKLATLQWVRFCSRCVYVASETV